MQDSSRNVFTDMNPNRKIGVSFRGSYARRVQSGFMQKYFSGAAILDMGYRGGDPDAVPITENAIGIELDYPGYDGIHLPFPDESQDTVLAAHVLEHALQPKLVLKDWYRVLKNGGFMVVIVPHRDLYERAYDLPSRWNGDHKRLYTPANLLAEIEDALPVNGYRIRHLLDNDFAFDYGLEIDSPPKGCYEIELVIEKIKRPAWSDRLRYPPAVQKAIDQIDSLVFQAVSANLRQDGAGTRVLSAMFSSLMYFPPWNRLHAQFLNHGIQADGKGVKEDDLRKAVRSLLDLVQFDPNVYTSMHVDLYKAYTEGKVRDLRLHWLNHGYFEGRIGLRVDQFVV